MPSGLLDIEQVIPGAVGFHQPKHREVDIDDVLVAGEHQALLGHIAHRRAATQILDEPHADIDTVDAGHLGSQHRLDGMGR